MGSELRWQREHTLLASAIHGAGTGYSNTINAGEYSQALFFLETTTHAGTSPTLNLTMQVSYDGSTWFDTTSTFAQSVTENKIILASTTLGKYVRFSYTIAGTDTPAFTFSLVGVFKS